MLHDSFSFFMKAACSLGSSSVAVRRKEFTSASSLRVTVGVFSGQATEWCSWLLHRVHFTWKACHNSIKEKKNVRPLHHHLKTYFLTGLSWLRTPGSPERCWRPKTSSRLSVRFVFLARCSRLNTSNWKKIQISALSLCEEKSKGHLVHRLARGLALACHSICVIEHNVLPGVVN